MQQETYIKALRMELLEMVEKQLTPVALHYEYSEIPLETNIKWRPLVLVLGNYSSGKSALINELLGADIQATGQAPTDDSFTILTCENAASQAGRPIQVTDERDGKFLLNDPEYPFETLKKHGQRFTAHFRLKKVNSPFLKNLAIIDTPGMLDSISEKDRGYNYQEVIGDLAQIADLILVLFDPHKAGTIREAHTSLRDTLPARTFEDRVIFVLNRIDECASLSDLLRVYGTLCWNLSQITGRKDIPMIRLTYSASAATDFKNRSGDTTYLKYLENQREELKKAVSDAPQRRLDNLATFVETHSEHLSHFLEALVSYRVKLRTFRIKSGFLGFLGSLAASAGSTLLLMLTGLLGGVDLPLLLSTGGGLAILVFVLWVSMGGKFLEPRFHTKQLENIDNLTKLKNQTRRDSWQAIRELTVKYLKKTKGEFPLWELQYDLRSVTAISKEGSKQIREALNELAQIKRDTPAEN
jgi:energy-coupling factor transporter ATP-binding protein EcfA2